MARFRGYGKLNLYKYGFDFQLEVMSILTTVNQSLEHFTNIGLVLTILSIYSPRVFSHIS